MIYAMLACRLLGAVEVWLDDLRIDLGFPRQRILLAILLVEANRLVTVETLIDRIWTDHPPARAAHALYAAVSKLRRALTAAPGLDVVRHTGGYLIETDPTTIDLHTFRALFARAHHADTDEDTAALLDRADTYLRLGRQAQLLPELVPRHATLGR
jgi:DNA-binding SARP family transcriptional activator